MPTKVKELVAMMEQDGWRQVRQKGHRQFRHDRKAGTVTMAGKDSLEIPAGTPSSSLTQAGLKK